MTGAPLELPAVHFMCGHSCNLRNLGENEKECPICAPQFRTILDIRRSLRTGAQEQVYVDHFINIENYIFIENSANETVSKAFLKVFSGAFVLHTILQGCS